MRKSTANCCILFLLLFLVACSEELGRTDSGLQYKIIRGNGNGPVAASGSTVKLHYTQYVHDTMTTTTRGNLPYYKALIPGTIFPYDPFEVLAKGVREGDSIVVYQRMDSLLVKGRLQKIPSNLKPEDQLVIGIKILKVFPFEIMKPGEAENKVEEDKQQERHKMDSLQAILGPKRVEEYLRKKNITAPVNAQGAFVEIISPGEGMQADSGKTVLAKYTVSTLRGKVLDTNMDTAMKRESLRFTIGMAYMPPIVDQSIRSLKKGGHAKIYLPAMVAIHDMPNPGEQPSYDDLVFEIILEEVF